MLIIGGKTFQTESNHMKIEMTCNDLILEKRVLSNEIVPPKMHGYSQRWEKRN